jgi:hypothetical protein
MRILPLESSVMLMATMPVLMTLDHWPTRAGSVTVLAVLTVCRAEVATLPAKSVARAESLCVPLAVRAVLKEVVKGYVVSGAPRGCPSRRNWTLPTPVMSEAVAETETEPVSVAAPGDVTETTGGEFER